jgi:hypothetical protein
MCWSVVEAKLEKRAAELVSEQAHKQQAQMHSSTTGHTIAELSSFYDLLGISLSILASLLLPGFERVKPTSFDTLILRPAVSIGKC